MAKDGRSICAAQCCSRSGLYAAGGHAECVSRGERYCGVVEAGQDWQRSTATGNGHTTQALHAIIGCPRLRPTPIWRRGRRIATSAPASTPSRCRGRVDRTVVADLSGSRRPLIPAPVAPPVECTAVLFTGDGAPRAMQITPSAQADGTRGDRGGASLAGLRRMSAPRLGPSRRRHRARRGCDCSSRLGGAADRALDGNGMVRGELGYRDADPDRGARPDAAQTAPSSSPSRTSGWHPACRSRPRRTAGSASRA